MTFGSFVRGRLLHVPSNIFRTTRNRFGESKRSVHRHRVIFLVILPQNISPHFCNCGFAYMGVTLHKERSRLFMMMEILWSVPQGSAVSNNVAFRRNRLHLFKLKNS